MNDSLRGLLEAFKDVPDEGFDPEQHIGEIRDKVDAIKWRIDSWRAEAAALQKWIVDLKSKEQSLVKAADRLEEYLKEQMLRGEWDKLPGNLWRVQVQKSTPSVEVTLTPTAQTYMAYPRFMKQEITYSWLKDAIKANVDADGNLPIPGASLKHGKHIRFYPVKGKANDTE